MESGTDMLNGLMMDEPLSLIDVLEYGAEVHATQEIVTAHEGGGTHRQTYPQTLARVAQLAHALVRLGIGPGDRVGTLAWNNHRHVELYYATAGMGAVCHTINPRLPPEQLSYVIQQAEDKLIFFDTTFAPLIAKLRGLFPQHTRYVAMAAPTDMPRAAGLDDVLCFEDLLAGQAVHYDWPRLDENAACALCFTSGTTGQPKGVLYSQRSCLLAVMFAEIGSDAASHVGDRLLPVVPLFHVNGWGTPYIAPLTGMSLVMPGPQLDGASLFQLMDDERVTVSYGVPTVWLWLLAEIKKQGRKPRALRQVLVGGSAPPRNMIWTFEHDYGVEVRQGWGMTETNPIGTMGILTGQEGQLPLEQRVDIKARGGRRLFGVRMKIVDDHGQALPHDGHAEGQLYVRGPTVAKAYFKDAAATAKAYDAGGWFGTGDVARIEADGLMRIVDRTKDVIKSGGEWISSIDMENFAAAYPGVVECAVIAVPDPKWAERPLLVVVPDPHDKPTEAGLKKHLAQRFAKWQLPDRVLFVTELPHTATGKVSKRRLRDRYSKPHLALKTTAP
ncbi:MAG TPA: long-chain fatty acid--CoA ligase [Nevskiaceae bacterium]|nr:long-chain fatty acid--CoA ligase [Nevskiaceae bacterium]